MQQLPKGYYAVQSDFDNAPKDSFTYKGVTYAVIEGINLFATLEEANQKATEIPRTPLEGLLQQEFSTPVILFSVGTHSIDMFQFDRSLTLLGNGAQISPNIPTEDTLEPPTLNPMRSEEKESVFKGSYWRGRVFAKSEEAKEIIFDGFSSLGISFRDLRTDGGDCCVIFRNMIYLSPCGNNLHQFAPAKADGSLNREVIFQNIRSVDFYDYDYGGNFILANAKKTIIDGLVYDSTGQIFGFTDIARTHTNCALNTQFSEIQISDSYFRNLSGNNGIATGCGRAETQGLNLTVTNTVFVDAGRENEAVLNPHLNNNSSSLLVNNCTFVDTRQNSGAAISVFGGGDHITLKDCTFTGYAETCSRKPAAPMSAPDHIEAYPQNWMTATADPHCIVGTKNADFSRLDALYSGCKPYYGDLHVHTQSGGTSDGLVPIGEWPTKMDEKKVDFAAVVDHKQMRGFFLPEWDEERFIIGTEPGTRFSEGLNAVRYNQAAIHYIMLFPHKYGLAMVLANFPEYNFRGDELTGSFVYPKFTKERFLELTAYVQSIGGIMIHPHPKLTLASDDPLDYYIGEHTFMETIYESPTAHATYKNYDLWVKLLALGKRVYASGGSDTHGEISNKALSTFYTREKSGKAFFEQMRTADFTVGPLGLKMCIDGYPMGSEISYREGMKLTLRMDDFFSLAWRDETAYELRILTDKGIAYASLCNGKQSQAIELEVQKREFYRAEVYDLTHDCLIAVGNPIWLNSSNNV